MIITAIKLIILTIFCLIFSPIVLIFQFIDWAWMGYYSPMVYNIIGKEGVT